MVGIDYALDDLTNTKFNTLGEIVYFYGLPVIPDNVSREDEFKNK